MGYHSEGSPTGYRSSSDFRFRWRQSLSLIHILKGINEIVDACNEGWLRGDNINYTGQKGQSYSKLTDLDYVFRTFGDMPVSYTHLDVYKRQVLQRTSISARGF